MKEFFNLFLFIGICFLLYILFRSFNYTPLREGMTDSSGNAVVVSSTSNGVANGVAGNAAAYAAAIKSFTIKLSDEFLISKYRSDYETAILNLDDLINNLMLNTALTFSNINDKTIERLAQMQQAKVALNSVMKFVDSSS
jgi:hypothetical protein